MIHRLRAWKICPGCRADSHVRTHFKGAVTAAMRTSVEPLAANTTMIATLGCVAPIKAAASFCVIGHRYHCIYESVGSFFLWAVEWSWLTEGRLLPCRTLLTRR